MALHTGRECREDGTASERYAQTAEINQLAKLSSANVTKFTHVLPLAENGEKFVSLMRRLLFSIILNVNVMQLGVLVNDLPLEI